MLHICMYVLKKDFSDQSEKKILVYRKNKREDKDNKSISKTGSNFCNIQLQVIRKSNFYFQFSLLHH